MIFTVENAKTKLCPVSRTFSDTVSKTCRADDCILWRWRKPQANDPEFVAAVKSEMDELAKENNAKTKAGFHKQAVKNVMENPEKYDLVLREKDGYCGLGGDPK